MNYRPLIMSAEMALAYRDGRKRQTRRIISKAGRFCGITEFGPSVSPRYSWHFRDARMQWQYLTDVELLRNAAFRPGDGLWVREPLASKGPWTTYVADGADATDWAWQWKPKSLAARYMPKILCRTLGVCEDVRVTRVQEITEEDAKAEGVSAIISPITGSGSFRVGFCRLWNDLHGNKPGERWEDNPWVYVYCLSEPITTDHAEAQRLLGETP